MGARLIEQPHSTRQRAVAAAGERHEMPQELIAIGPRQPVLRDYFEQ